MPMSPALRRRTAPAAVVAFVLTALAVGASMAPAGAASKDSQLAEEGVIVASDLPDDWSSRPNDDSSDKKTEKVAKKISACKGYLKARKALDGATKASSRTFLVGEEDLQNDVWAFGKASQAKKAFALMADPGVADCLTDAFQALFDDLVGSDPSVADLRVAIAQTTNLPALGDDIVGYAGGAQATMTDRSVERLPVANLIVLVGRTIVSYAFTGGPSATGEYTPTLLDGVDDAVAETVTRLQDAQ